MIAPSTFDRPPAGLDRRGRLAWSRTDRRLARLLETDEERAHRAKLQAKCRAANYRTEATCDICDKRKPGTMHHQPDAAGLPTPVLFVCDGHEGW